MRIDNTEELMMDLYANMKRGIPENMCIHGFEYIRYDALDEVALKFVLKERKELDFDE